MTRKGLIWSLACSLAVAMSLTAWGQESSFATDPRAGAQRKGALPSEQVLPVPTTAPAAALGKPKVEILRISGGEMNAMRTVPGSPIHDAGFPAAAVAEGCGGASGACGGCGTAPCAVGNCNTCVMETPCWVRGEYMVGWTTGQRLPPLLTTGSGALPGALGDPRTRVLFGGQEVNDQDRHGFRVGLGGYFDNACRIGMQAGFFLLPGMSTKGQAGSPTTAVSRPFTNAQSRAADIEVVSLPGDTNGTSTVNARSGDLLGADALLRCNLCCECGYRIDFLAGYRYLQLGEKLTVNENLQPLVAPFVRGTRILVQDSFGTDNYFNGGTVGLSLEAQRGNWCLEVAPRLSIGGNSRTVRIQGLTSVSVPGQTQVTGVGGLLAQTSNIGKYESCEFSLVPELDLTVSYRICSWLRASAGYSGLYWGKLVRPGNQIDLTVNRDLIPPQTATTGPQRPAYSQRSSDLWMHGVRAGLELRW